MRKKFDWSLIYKLILDNYKILAQRKLRGSYYIIRDALTPFVASGKFSQEQYNAFLKKDKYDYYGQDIWSVIEQKYGLVRPEAKPIGIVFDNGVEYSVSHLEEVWEQARGFIFVEKADEADDIKLLSEFGWVIISGQGFSTRLMRKLLKQDTRPVLALHDADSSGDWIYRTLGFPTERTWHLDIALGDQVTDLGLTKEQAKALNLPSQPEVPKEVAKGNLERWELSSLNVLVSRMELQNPVLAFVVSAMKARGIKLSPTEIRKGQLYGDYLMGRVWDAFRLEVVKTIAKTEFEIEGTAVKIDESEETVVPKLPDELQKEVIGLSSKLVSELKEKLLSEVKWKYEKDFEKEAEKYTTKELTELLKGADKV